MVRTSGKPGCMSSVAWPRPLSSSAKVGLLLIGLALWMGGIVSAGEEDPFVAQGFVRFQQEPTAPDFTLLDHAGTPQILHDLQGHAILLAFWTTW